MIQWLTAVLRLTYLCIQKASFKIIVKVTLGKFLSFLGSSYFCGPLYFRGIKDKIILLTWLSTSTGSNINILIHHHWSLEIIYWFSPFHSHDTYKFFTYMDASITPKLFQPVRINTHTIIQTCTLILSFIGSHLTLLIINVLCSFSTIISVNTFQHSR